MNGTVIIRRIEAAATVSFSTHISHHVTCYASAIDNVFCLATKTILEIRTSAPLIRDLLLRQFLSLIRT